MGGHFRSVIVLGFLSKKVDPLQCLQDCAGKLWCAEIEYRKLGEQRTSTRIVEPYALTFNGPDLIVQTWQVDPPICPEPCWRNFRLDRMQRVRATNHPFRARVPVTITTGEMREFVFGDDPATTAKGKTPAERKYHDYVLKALADNTLTTRELSHATKLSDGFGLTQRKAIHCQVYAAMLNDHAADGDLSAEEEQLLSNVRVYLQQLGWCP